LLDELRLRDGDARHLGGHAFHRAPLSATAHAPVDEDQQHEDEDDKPQNPLQVLELIPHDLQHSDHLHRAQKGTGFY
jgi:hypothetical protein